MNVLDASVSEIDFTPEEDADLHVDTFVIEAITKCMVAEEKIRKGGDEAWAGEKGCDDVVLEQVRMRTFERTDVFWDGHGQWFSESLSGDSDRGIETSTAKSSKIQTRSETIRQIRLGGQ